MSSSESESKDDLQDAYTPKKTTSGRFAPAKSLNTAPTDTEIVDESDEMEVGAAKTRRAGPSPLPQVRPLSSQAGTGSRRVGVLSLPKGCRLHEQS